MRSRGGSDVPIEAPAVTVWVDTLAPLLFGPKVKARVPPGQICHWLLGCCIW